MYGTSPGHQCLPALQGSHRPNSQTSPGNPYVPQLSPTVSITVEEVKEDSNGSLYIDDDNGNSSNGDGPDDLPPHSYDRRPTDLTPQEIQLTAEEWEEVNKKQKEADTELELFLDSEMKENGAKGAAEEARSNAAN